MPIYKVGNMWDVFRDADLFCITTNSVIRDDRLVMGKGIAGEAAKRYPSLPSLFADLIPHFPVGSGRDGLVMDKYGLALLSEEWMGGGYLGITPVKLAAFQTKAHWRNKAEFDLIHLSTRMLDGEARRNPMMAIHLPFPGIGYGGLNPFVVKPLIDNLPDNVTVWRDK